MDPFVALHYKYTHMITLTILSLFALTMFLLRRRELRLHQEIVERERATDLKSWER